MFGFTLLWSTLFLRLFHLNLPDMHVFDREPLADTLSLVLIQDIQIKLSFSCSSFIKMLLLLMSSSHGCVNLIFGQVSCNLCKKPIKTSQFAAHAGEALFCKVLYVVCSLALILRLTDCFSCPLCISGYLCRVIKGTLLWVTSL